MKTKILLGFLAFFMLQNVFSQSAFNVNGIVVDNQNKPVEYASVSVLDSIGDSLEELITTADGSFKFSLQPAKYTISFSGIGFLEQSQVVDVNNNLNLGNVSLIPENATIQLEGTTIVGEKPIYKVDLDKKVYNLAQDPIARGGSLSDALQNVPSVQVDGEGNVSVRGNSNVKILIDGKPSGMVGISDPTEALKNIPAETVERIEVITNPSARYEASGNAGIINIVLKKASASGLNGNLTVLGGDPTSIGANANINYKIDKWNINAGLNYKYSERIGGSEVRNIYYLEDGSINYKQNQDSKRKRFGNNYGINLGADYALNDKNIFSVGTNYRYNLGGNNTNVNYWVYDDLNNLTEESWRNQKQKKNEYNLDFNLGYKHKFNDHGHELSIDARSSLSREDETANINELSSLNSSSYAQSLSLEKQEFYTFSSDYTYPITEKSKLEAGVRADLQKTTTDYKVNELENGAMVPLDDFTAYVINNQNVYAAYTQFSQKFTDKLSVLGGLRMEVSDMKINSVLENNVVKKDYVDFFPSATLNYNVTDKNQLQLSYSRRIKRPMGFMLIPFFTYSDNRNTMIGNPNLDPMYTNALELSYITNIGKLMITPNLYYQHTNQNVQMFQTTRLSDDQVIFVTQPINVGSEDRYGLDLTFTFKPLKWWSMMGNINVYGYNTDGVYTYDYLNESNTTEQRTANFDGDGVSWFGRYSSTFNLPYKYNLQVAVNGEGGQKTAQYKTKDQVSMDLALTKDFLKNKFNVTVNVRDLFNSRRRTRESFGDDFYSWNKMWWNQRNVNLSISYKFNQKNTKQNKRENNFDGGGDFGDF